MRTEAFPSFRKLYRKIDHSADGFEEGKKIPRQAGPISDPKAKNIQWVKIGKKYILGNPHWYAHYYLLLVLYYIAKLQSNF